MIASSPGAAGKNFLEVDDLSIEELETVLDVARRVKQDPGAYANAIKGKHMVVLFEKHSTRTRVSLEVGIASMGGSAVILTADQLQLGRGETISDTARVFDRYADAIAARVVSHGSLEELADNADIPVMNALSDRAHPMQALADIQTLRERGARSVAYVGDGNNVAHSLMLASSMTGLDVRVASPAGFEPSGEVVTRAARYAAETGGRVLVTDDPIAAVEGVDAIYTDVWVSMGDEGSADARRSALASYQVNEALVSCAGPDAVVLHCLPAHRGEEIEASVLDGERSVVFDQAENRLHSQKALIAVLIGGVS